MGRREGGREGKREEGGRIGREGRRKGLHQKLFLLE